MLSVLKTVTCQKTSQRQCKDNHNTKTILVSPSRMTTALLLMKMNESQHLLNNQNQDLNSPVVYLQANHMYWGRRKGATVLNIFSDRDYNRSVLTIVADIELIGDVVLSASKRAFSLIDMSVHEGIHPCMGAVDLVPFYPLGEEVSMEDCAKKAQAIGTALIEQVPGTSAFFFGWADRPLHRGLAHRRKELGWFRKVPNMAAVRSDIGPPPGRRYGLTGIGASHYVMNCNVTIDTQEVSLGRDVAAAIRESSPGGIPGVQVIALPHEGMVEIACNVESVPSSAAGGESWPAFIFGEQTYCHAPASLITTRVAELARSRGVRTQGTALVGFTPLECKKLAETALSQDIGHFWKELHGVHM